MRTIRMRTKIGKIPHRSIFSPFYFVIETIVPSTNGITNVQKMKVYAIQRNISSFRFFEYDSRNRNDIAFTGNPPVQEQKGTSLHILAPIERSAIY